MVQTVGPRPLFWYVYSPKLRWGRELKAEKSRAKGFNVIIYSDGTVAYSRYADVDKPIERKCFKLPAAVADEYLMILQHEWWWVKDMPENILMEDRKPVYRNMFGLDRHPLIICDELKTLTAMEDVNRKGVVARRMHVMLEFVTELMFKHGILMQLQSFDWNKRMIEPIPDSEMDSRDLALIRRDEAELIEIAKAVNL